MVRIANSAVQDPQLCNKMRMRRIGRQDDIRPIGQSDIGLAATDADNQRIIPIAPLIAVKLEGFGLGRIVKIDKAHIGRAGHFLRNRQDKVTPITRHRTEECYAFNC